ncbi:hypothetical protein PsYK624_024250 [Phanerochaete sordida]|uniref:Uncharacterized protein n=1 Tax=Phanerochaete sordida TaxID=48140 RepID=A0A9P3G1S7_9APHY|nr:hypothetical protein PsYK624_024250 [Phanerochaete sordida]
MARLNPAHPAARISPDVLRKTMPAASHQHFRLRACHKAAMHRPETIWPDPPFREASFRPSQVNMSLSSIFKREGMFRYVTYRRRMKTRIMQALSLIVARGADVGKNEKGEDIVTFTDQPERDLVMKAWTYMIMPQPAMYRMPWPELVHSLRVGLTKIRDQCRQYQTKWNLATEKAQARSTLIDERESRRSRRSAPEVVKPERELEMPPHLSKRSALPTNKHGRVEHTKSSKLPKLPILHSQRTTSRDRVLSGESQAEQFSNKAEDVMAALRLALPAELMQDTPGIVDELEDITGSAKRDDPAVAQFPTISWQTVLPPPRKQVDAADEESANLLWAFKGRLKARTARAQAPDSPDSPEWDYSVIDRLTASLVQSRSGEQGGAFEEDSEPTEGRLSSRTFRRPATQSESELDRADKKHNPLKHLFTQRRILRPRDSKR